MKDLTHASRVAPPFPNYVMKDQIIALASTGLASRELRGITHYANRETWNLGEVVLWQKIIRSISRVKPEGWVGLMEEEFRHVDQSSLVSKFETNFPVSFSKMNKFYVGRITIRTTLQAMIASVYIDWMAGIKMGFCARLDCRKPYEITSSHKRTYCTPECAHHEVVRRSRNRALQKRQLAKKEKL